MHDIFVVHVWRYLQNIWYCIGWRILCTRILRTKKNWMHKLRHISNRWLFTFVNNKGCILLWRSRGSFILLDTGNTLQLLKYNTTVSYSLVNSYNIGCGNNRTNVDLKSLCENCVFPLGVSSTSATCDSFFKTFFLPLFDQICCYQRI